MGRNDWSDRLGARAIPGRRTGYGAMESGIDKDAEPLEPFTAHRLMHRNDLFRSCLLRPRGLKLTRRSASITPGLGLLSPPPWFITASHMRPFNSAAPSLTLLYRPQQLRDIPTPELVGSCSQQFRLRVSRMNELVTPFNVLDSIRSVPANQQPGNGPVLLAGALRIECVELSRTVIYGD